MIFRHKKLVATLVLVVQGLGGVAAKAGAAEVPDETVVRSGFSRKKADSDSELSTEIGDEIDPVSWKLTHGTRLWFPFIGGAALLAGLAAFVRHRLLSSGKVMVEDINSEPVIDIPITTTPIVDHENTKLDTGPKFPTMLNTFGEPFRSIKEWYNNIDEIRKGLVFILFLGSEGYKLELLELLIDEDLKNFCERFWPNVGVKIKKLRMLLYSGRAEFNKKSCGHCFSNNMFFLVIGNEDDDAMAHAESYYENFVSESDKKIPCVFILKIIDFASQKITKEQVKDFAIQKAKDRQWFFYEANAKTGESNLVIWSGAEELAPAPVPAPPA
jgi:hypothetical protein